MSLPNASVRVAGADLVAAGTLIPAQAFHPKVYVFGLEEAPANLMLGSANMTSRGFSSNTEAVWTDRGISLSCRAEDTRFSASALTITTIRTTVPLARQFCVAEPECGQTG